MIYARGTNIDATVECDRDGDRDGEILWWYGGACN